MSNPTPSEPDYTQPPAEPTGPVSPEPPATPDFQPAPTVPPGYQAAPQPSAEVPGAVPPPPFATPGGGYNPPPPPMPGYHAAYGGPGPSPVKPYAPRAITGFVLSAAAGALSLISFFTLGIITFPLAIAGVIVSHLGFNDTKKNPDVRGRGLGLAGIIVGYITIAALLIALALFVVLIIVGAANGCSSTGAGQASCHYGTESSFGTSV